MQAGTNLCRQFHQHCVHLRDLQRALLDIVNLRLAYVVRQLIADRVYFDQQRTLVTGRHEIMEAVKAATQGERHDA